MNLHVGPISSFPVQPFQNMTLTGVVVVQFCQWTGVHSALAHSAIVRLLAIKALQRRFPMLQAYNGRRGCRCSYRGGSRTDATTVVHV
jgi:hypothetical protein